MKIDERKTHTILIIGVEYLDGQIMKENIEAAGFAVKLALDGTGVHNIISDQYFSLVVINISENFNWIETITHIKTISVNIPVIAVSKYSSEDRVLQSFRLGAEDYVLMPYNLNDFIKRIETAIRIKEIVTDNEIKDGQKNSLIESLEREADYFKKKLMDYEARDKNSVVKSIDFDEDTCQAGISILSYFSTVVAQKYPDTKVKVRIEQEGLKVRLVVETPTGEKENIEKTLEEYGLVLSGQIQPEELLPNTLQVMQLKHKLDLAVMEVSHTKELLYTERASFGKQLDGLKEEVDHLKHQISEAFKREEHSRVILTKIIDKYSLDDSAKDAVLKLSLYLEQGVGERDKEIILELLEVIKKQDTFAFDDIKAYMISSLGGASGNLISTWLPMVFAAIQRI